jgi:RND family efflux transporter MFP subunit
MSKSTLDDLRIERRPERPPSSTPRMAIVGVLILLAAGAAFWWFSRPGIPEVTTEVARESGGASGSADRTVLNASGYVTARREATVSSKSTGKVLEVLFDEGNKVKEGQVLARLDDSNLKASLDVAQAQLDSTRLQLDETRAQLKQADSEYQRDVDLFKAKIESQSDLDKAESDAMTLRARVARQERDIIAAEKQVDLWKQQIDDMIIRAPFDGVATTKDAQPGEMISPVSAGGGFTRTGIGTIVDMNSLEIEIDVNESYINRVEPGQPVEAVLDAYSDWRIPGKVIAIIPTADRQKATVKVRVGFDKLDPRILPDMAVKVAFQQSASAPAASARAVLVPKSAVQNRNGHDVVFIFGNNRAERRAVTVSDTRGDDDVISAGVNAGEKVIVETPPGLKDGAAVKEKKS